MLVRDEFKCRRCGVLFFGGDTNEFDSVVDLVNAELSRSDIPTCLIPHECHFGGVGIGDWIGASEVKTASGS